MNRKFRSAALIVLATAAAVLAAGSASSGTAKPGFSSPQYVDTALAGGEPLIMANPLHGTLVYSSHEGTTHLYRDGIVNSPFGDFQFVANYCNQVNIWTSSDNGVTWQRDKYMDSPCPTSPAINTGFSDPDLTNDASGRIYDTGIDLVNDAVFSSGDGGKTFDEGTPQCHDGDRPWLAGGKANEVFMSTDTEEGTPSHQMFQSTDGGQTCSSTGIPDGGTLNGVSYSGFGKLYMDNTLNRIAEPEVFSNSNGTVGVGVGTWIPRRCRVHAALRRVDERVRTLARARDRQEQRHLSRLGHRRPAAEHRGRVQRCADAGTERNRDGGLDQLRSDVVEADHGRGAAELARVLAVDRGR